jgi:hypothetical protein
MIDSFLNEFLGFLGRLQFVTCLTVDLIIFINRSNTLKSKNIPEKSAPKSTTVMNFIISNASIVGIYGIFLCSVSS